MSRIVSAIPCITMPGVERVELSCGHTMLLARRPYTHEGAERTCEACLMPESRIESIQRGKDLGFAIITFNCQHLWVIPIKEHLAPGELAVTFETVDEFVGTYWGCTFCRHENFEPVNVASAS